MPAVTFSDAGKDWDLVLFMLLSALLRPVHFAAGLYSSFSSSLVLFKDVESFPPPPSPIRVTVAFCVLFVVFLLPLLFMLLLLMLLLLLVFLLVQRFLLLCCTSSGGDSSRFWGGGGFIVYCLLFISFRTTAGAFSVAFANIFAVIVGCVVTFFPWEGFNKCPKDLYDKPSTITSSFFPDPSTHWGSRQSSGGSCLLGEQAMPSLLSTALTSSTCPYLAKRPPSCFH